MHESWDGPDRRSYDADSPAVMIGRIDENIKHLRREFSQASQSQASAYAAMLKDIADIKAKVAEIDKAADKGVTAYRILTWMGAVVGLAVIGTILATSGIAA